MRAPVAIGLGPQVGHDRAVVVGGVDGGGVGDFPKVRPVMSEDNLSEKVSVSNIYGAVEVRDADGYWLKGA